MQMEGTPLAHLGLFEEQKRPGYRGTGGRRRRDTGTLRAAGGGLPGHSGAGGGSGSRPPGHRCTGGAVGPPGHHAPPGYRATHPSQPQKHRATGALSHKTPGYRGTQPQDPRATGLLGCARGVPLRPAQACEVTACCLLCQICLLPLPIGKAHRPPLITTASVTCRSSLSKASVKSRTSSGVSDLVCHVSIALAPEHEPRCQWAQ